MSNLMFALNATIPLFILIALGFFLRKVKIVDAPFLKTANKFNFKLTLPMLLFVDLAGTDFRETFDLKFLLFCAIATSIAFWGTWGLAKAFIKDKNSRGEFVQACYRSSAAVMGLALIQNIYGSSGMAGMMMLGCVPLYNIYAVILLQTESPEGETVNADGTISTGSKKGSGKIKKAVLGILTNPIVIGIVLGLVSSLIGIQYPTIIQKALDYVARLATPLALICIGAEFSFANAFKKIKLSAIAACVKIILLPVIFTTIAILMGYRMEKLVAIFIMLAGPTTPSCFIMAKQYGFEGTVTSSTVVLTTLFTSVTLTAFIFILRSLGYI